MLTGKIFISGGAGFLARAIYRRARAEAWDCQFTAFSRDDSKHVALRKRYPEVVCVRGDVAGDRDYLAAAMRGHDLVIHAAATKYVDLAETNVFDTVRVNVHGSENVAWAAMAAGVTRVVGISTDKACQPVNVYGATKMVMERVFVEADRLDSATEFTLCRYGNVIGSTGSVIPLFKTQLARDGHISITDPTMTRFWMSADDAVDTILYALNQAQHGSTVIPSPKASSIMDVVDAIGPCDFRVVGIRPGEKLSEDLIHEQESVRAAKRYPGFWELRPPGEVVSSRQFRLNSSEADRIPSAELAALIADAETI